jgi:hypothetical protein
MVYNCKQCYLQNINNNSLRNVSTRFYNININKSSGEKITTNFNSVIYPTLPIKSIKTSSSLYSYLPQTFNLTEYGDISTRYDYGTDNLLYPVVKQHSCGSCWAWAVASMLSDRYALAFNKPNPKISPTGIISGIYCMMKRSSEIELYDACQGGSSYDALILVTDITQSPTPVLCDPLVSSSKDDLRMLFKSLDCDNYDWCDKNPRCNKSLLYKASNKHLLDQFAKEGDLNELVPDYTVKCQTYNILSDSAKVQALPSITSNSIDIKIKRCYALEDIESIKYSLFTKGTVITNFVIYPDIINKPDDQKLYWEETDNIYIHKKGCSIYDLGEPLDNDDLLGFHSATIVGWGQHKFNRKRLFEQLKIPFKSGDPDSITISYWIGRNTWGDGWNGNGYFKIAFTDKALGINTEVGADIPINLHLNACYLPCEKPCDKGNDKCQIIPFGGCCAADIEIAGEADDTVETDSRYYVASKSIISKFAKLDMHNNTINTNEFKSIIFKNKLKVFLLLILVIILIYLIYKQYRK